MRNSATRVAVARITVPNVSRTTDRAELACGCEIAVPKGAKSYYHNRCAKDAVDGVVKVDTTRVAGKDGTSVLVDRTIAHVGATAPADPAAPSIVLVESYGRRSSVVLN